MKRKKHSGLAQQLVTLIMLSRKPLLGVLLSSLACYTVVVNNKDSSSVFSDIETLSITMTNSSSVVVHNETIHNERPILFLHFQKSGGSSVCSIMQKQQQVNMTYMMGHPRRTANCNVELSDPHVPLDSYPTLQTCRLLQTYIMDENSIPFRRNNFLAVEVPFQDVMPCPGFRSSAIMRDPVERLKSLMRYRNLSNETVSAWINNTVTSRFTRQKGMDGYPIVNDMVIRQLLGRRRFFDLTPVGSDDLEKAKKQVDTFDVFVPLEYLQNEKVLERLRMTVPEYHEGLTRNPVVVNKNVNGEKRVIDPALIKRIADENVYDTMLYQYMLEKLGITQ